MNELVIVFMASISFPSPARYELVIIYSILIKLVL